MIKSIKEKIKRGDVSIGSWITLAHPSIAEIMANAGFDWLAVDLEHSVITIRETEEIIRIIDLCGVVPLVRLSSNDPIQIKRVMDAGAHGVIVPMVNSMTEAERAVSAVRYPPMGKRSFGLARAQGYGANFDGYLDWIEKESIIIVQVEHIASVDNLEAILGTDGVDGFFVGPYDLSGSLGVPGRFNHPLMKKTLEKIHNVGFASGKVPGIHIIDVNEKEIQERVNQGYRFIACSVDIRMLESSCSSAIKVIRNLSV